MSEHLVRRQVSAGPPSALWEWKQARAPPPAWASRPLARGAVPGGAVTAGAWHSLNCNDLIPALCLWLPCNYQVTWSIAGNRRPARCQPHARGRGGPPTSRGRRRGSRIPGRTGLGRRCFCACVPGRGPCWRSGAQVVGTVYRAEGRCPPRPSSLSLCLFILTRGYICIDFRGGEGREAPTGCLRTRPTRVGPTAWCPG